MGGGYDGGWGLGKDFFLVGRILGGVGGGGGDARVVRPRLWRAEGRHFERCHAEEVGMSVLLDPISTEAGSAAFADVVALADAGRAHCTDPRRERGGEC